MAAAGSLSAAMSTGAGQAQGGSPGVLACRSVGCPKCPMSVGHRYCCSHCKRNPVGIHSKRCEKQYRRLSEHLRDVNSECITTGCTLRVGMGHLTCCSSCGGAQHTLGCNRRRGRFFQQAMHGATWFMGSSQHLVQGQSLGTGSQQRAGQCEQHGRGGRANIVVVDLTALD